MIIDPVNNLTYTEYQKSIHEEKQKKSDEEKGIITLPNGRKIDTTKSIDLYSLQNILSTDRLSDVQKTRFLRNNHNEIRKVLEISGKDFAIMMENRPLIKYQPIKNSFTKRADKIILATSLGISPKEIDSMIDKSTTEIKNCAYNGSSDELKKVITYVYRHGTQKQVAICFEHELQKTLDIAQYLQKTLEYSNGGVADYFSRPIHSMKDRTFIALYNIVNKSLTQARADHKINDETLKKTTEWALAKLYEIRNNSKLFK